MQPRAWSVAAAGSFASLLASACAPPSLEHAPGAEHALVVPELLDARAHPQFVSPLPNPLDPSFVFAPIDPADRPPGVPADCDDYYEIGMHPIEQSLGLFDPETGAPMTTRVWGYGTGPGFPDATFPGRTIVARGDAAGVHNRKVCVQWTNDLVDAGGAPIPHLVPIDTSLHWAFSPPDFEASMLETHGVPVVPHVHGGHTESDSDGLPQSWWTPGRSLAGQQFVKSLYEYDNDQQAGTIWYHDHALGITRLNVYAGLAGFYLIRDDADTGAPDNPLDLPAFPYEVPIVIQDRSFTADGQLFYPTVPDEVEPGYPPPPDPSALPEVFGDFVLVNGVAWPYLDVEPRRYRFRVLNGSDSRFYEIRMTSGSRGGDGPEWIVIGTDDGLLYRPVARDRIVLGPGERYDVVVDFAGWEGEELIVRNGARSPFPRGTPPTPQTTGRVMAFRVGHTVTVPDEPLPEVLRAAPIDPESDLGPLDASTPRRRLLLFEGLDRYGRLQPMLGVAEPTTNVEGDVVDGTLLFDDHLHPITENPGLGDVEIWEVFNATADAHPIHLHLVAFQLLDRQRYRATIVEEGITAHDGSTSLGGRLTDIRRIGRPRPPERHEAGWKDTAIMLPGQVTRLVARFDRPGRYVWHCHILSHEDHEMMRPYCVGDYETECE